MRNLQKVLSVSVLLIAAIPAQEMDLPTFSLDESQATIEWKINELKSAGQTRFMTSISTSMSGRSGANEVLRDGLAGSLLEQYAITKEITFLEEAWTRLSTKGAVAYGHKELLQALEEGAIETALITADLLRDENEKIGNMTWSKWAEGLEAIGADLIQCSTDHDSGQQLLGMGGAIALLRYRMDG